MMIHLLTLLLASPPASAEAVMALAVAGHPSLEALDARVAALDARIPAADVWADPMVGLEYSNMPLTRPWPGEHPMSGLQLKLSQRIPGAGKIAARRALARESAQAARSTLPEARNAIAGAAGRLFHRLALARQLRALIEAHAALVDQLEEVARAKYEVGRGAQHEVLQLQLLRERLAEQSADLAEEAVALQAQLDAALRRTEPTPILTPGETPLPPAPAPLAALVERAAAEHPTLRRLAAAAKVEAAAASRADAERGPDVTVSAGYRVRRAVEGGDMGDDFIGLGASMPLPWLWDDARWGSEASARRAQARGLLAQQAATRDDLRGRLGVAHATLRRARARAERHRAVLVPAARATLDSTFAAYRVGRADFQSIYRAQLEAVEVEKALRKAHAEAALAAVDLITLIGAAAPEEAP